MTVAAPSLTFNNITVTFESRPLFTDLSFQISAGKCTCLLGTSGCGKSTLLRIAARSRDIDYSGEVSYSCANPKIGWMSQNDLLLPWLSLLDNVMLGARLRSEVTAETRKKARHLLRAAGLEHYGDTLPHQLSGGMRQRGALLRTLLEEAQVVLMDEPFSALDAITRFKLQELASTMIAGRTTLLVTHDPYEALRMADKILVFSKDSRTFTPFVNLPGTPPRPANFQGHAELHDKILKLLLGEVQ